jgi:hypothetical protein
MPEPSKKPDPDPKPPEVDLSPHPIVKALLGGSDCPPQLVILVGYLGPSSKEGSVRLYTSLEFHSYYEIPRAGVARTEPADPDDASSPTRVYVAATAVLELVQVSRMSLEASLLGGAIASAYLPTAPADAYDPTHAAHPAQACDPVLDATHLPTTTINVFSGLACLHPSQPPFCTRYITGHHLTDPPLCRPHNVVRSGLLCFHPSQPPLHCPPHPVVGSGVLCLTISQPPHCHPTAICGTGIDCLHNTQPPRCP